MYGFILKMVTLHTRGNLNIATIWTPDYMLAIMVN